MTMGTGLANAVNADFATFVDRTLTFIYIHQFLYNKGSGGTRIYIYFVEHGRLKIRMFGLMQTSA